MTTLEYYSHKKYNISGIMCTERNKNIKNLDKKIFQ